MKRVSAMVLSLFFVLSAALVAQEPDTMQVTREARFVFDDSIGRNIVTFKSEAPLESILGYTSALYGYVDLNLDSLSEAPEAYFEVDLTKLTTGIEQRNMDMRSDRYLMTDSFPTASFELLGIRKTNTEVLENEGTAEMSIRGIFSFHGTIDTISCDAKVIYFEENEITQSKLPGDLLKLTAGFDIRMSDYGIVIPEDVILRVEDRIHIQVEAFGGTGVEPINRRAMGYSGVSGELMEEPADTAASEE